MQYDEKQLRRHLLECDIEVIPAAIISDTLKGSEIDGFGTLENGACFDGVVTQEKWDVIKEKLEIVPEHVATVATEITDAGNVRFQLTVSNDRLSEDETARLVVELNRHWNIRLPSPDMAQYC